MSSSLDNDVHVASVLEQVTDTKIVKIGTGAVRSAPRVFADGFGQATATVVADSTTMRAAGNRVRALLRAGGVETREPIVFADENLHATHAHVVRLQEALLANESIPVAVGSGTINDLTKLAAHRADRPYMVVATAASMDGYTAFGASIVKDGAKQTFFCPAPRAVVADSAILAAAPSEMNAAGYADLLAKVTAGADWILADALEIEPLHEQAWQFVQGGLREQLGNPAGVQRGEPQALATLLEGLMLSGFAMQVARSSRPASGADHQFSHLWDMQHHRFQGHIPLHGQKVGIGLLCSALLYEQLLSTPLETLDIARLRGRWSRWEELPAHIRRTHSSEELRQVAMTECRAKYPDESVLEKRLRRLVAIWPELRGHLAEQLIPFETMRDMLRQVGAPTHPSEIGIDLDRLRRSHHEAQQIRRRYTILDLALETGMLETWLDRIFTPGGPWNESAC